VHEVTTPALTPDANASRLRRHPLRARAAGLFAVMVSTTGPVAAQAPGLGAGVELVSPDLFRVCADPRNMPLSNDAGEGFENRIAALLADRLGRKLTYVYAPQVIGFFRNTLFALRCDIVIGVAFGDSIVQTTIPYYHTVYSLVFRPGTGLDGVTSLADLPLRDRHIGVIAGAPPASVVLEYGLMTLARSFPLVVDTRVDAPVRAMIDEIAAGRLDAGIMPATFAAYFARRSDPPLATVPLVRENGAHMDFRIAMGVRPGDQEWKRMLNRLIVANQAEINHILAEFGVPLLNEAGELITP